MGNGRGTRDQLRASGASKGAPYGRTLPLERDGRWAEGAAYITVFFIQAYLAGWERNAGTGEREPRPDVGVLGLPQAIRFVYRRCMSGCTNFYSLHFKLQ